MTALQTAVDLAAAHEIGWARDPDADLTFSIAKTCLAILAGVAHDAGRLPEPDEPVRARLPGIGFDTPHNAAVTWTQLLRQTSAWKGECFGLPDQVDRWRTVAHGATHWGGGVSISARDQARIGLLLLRQGRHEGRTLLSAGWVERMRQPCALAPFYGMLRWLNSAQRPVHPSAGRSSVFMIGAGGHVAWLDPERELVVASRWLQAERTDRLFGLIAEAVDDLA